MDYINYITTELLKFSTSNWITLIIILCIIGFAIYKIIHHFHEERYTISKDVIELKNELIEDQRRKMDAITDSLNKTKHEYANTKNKLEQIANVFYELKTDYDKMKLFNRAVKELDEYKSNYLIAYYQLAVSDLKRISVAKSLILIYIQILNEDGKFFSSEESELINLIDRIESAYEASYSRLFSNSQENECDFGFMDVQDNKFDDSELTEILNLLLDKIKSRMSENNANKIGY